MMKFDIKNINAIYTSIGITFILNIIRTNIISPLVNGVSINYRIMIVLLLVFNITIPYFIDKLISKYSEKNPRGNFHLLKLHELVYVILNVSFIIFLFLLLFEKSIYPSKDIEGVVLQLIITIFVLSIFSLSIFSMTFLYVIKNEEALTDYNDFYNKKQSNIDICLDLQSFFHRLQNAAITATSAVFKTLDKDRVKFILVYNQRYNWWLPPGTHCRDWELGTGKSPSKRAYEAMRKEGLVDGRILETFHTPSVDLFESINFLESPPYLFWLRVPDNTNAAKCHSYHLDFFYIFDYTGELQKIDNEEVYRKIWVTIQKNDSEENIKRNISEEIRRENGKSSRPVHDDFPPDLPQRMWLALEYYKSHSGN